MSSNRLSLDLNHAMSLSCGRGGLSEEDFSTLLPPLKRALASIAQQRSQGGLAWVDLPSDEAARREIQTLAAGLAGKFDDLVVLGIGGSSLGARAVFEALSHPFHNLLARDKRPGMRLFFPDNSDPNTLSALLDTLDLKHTAFAAVTKSGGTAETLAQLSVVKSCLDQSVGAQAFASQVVAVTDPKEGALRAIATQEGLASLPVPPAVGGRFSVLSACGLLPAAAAGIDVEALCAGASSVAKRFEEPANSNAPAMLAALLHFMDQKRARPLHVLMPYADALRGTGDWFVQLWAESLGKKQGDRAVGPTPLRAVGATDQHSLLQLLMEGPSDKVVVFVSVEEVERDLEIPKVFAEHRATDYLAGLPMSRLLDTERRATTLALAKSERPSVTLKLPRLDAFHLGEMLMFFELATAVAGELYGVNPYDQPGVELGKRYTGGMLGREGYEADGREVKQHPAPRAEFLFS